VTHVPVREHVTGILVREDVKRDFPDKSWDRPSLRMQTLHIRFRRDVEPAPARDAFDALFPSFAPNNLSLSLSLFVSRCKRL
jgi:hypothetical protein